jgi:hypothetical protein
MDLVERYLQRKRKHPYYAMLLEMANGNYEQAERFAYQLKSGGMYDQARNSALVHILIEHNRLEEAKEMAEKIKNHNIRYHNLAIIALQQENGSLFEKLVNEIKHNGIRYALQAEAAYRRGDLAEAERLGVLAISSTGGIHKYILIKSLERQQNNSARRSYF